MSSTTTTPPNTTAAKKGNASFPSSTEEQGLGWVKGIGLEWAKITWPTRMQLMTNVIVVLLMTSAMTLFVWLVDSFFRWGIHLITPEKMGR
jgi:preprotein translocase SecE subunit